MIQYPNDPKVGNQRQKKLLANIAQKVMAQRGRQGSALGRFGKLGGQESKTRGRVGGIAGLGGGAQFGHKAFGSLGAVTARGLNADHNPEFRQALENRNAGGPETPASLGQYNSQARGGDPNAGTYQRTGGTSQDPNVGHSYDWGVQYANSPEAQSEILGQVGGGGGAGSGSVFAPSTDVGLGADILGGQAGGPSSPITAGGGLVPLGNGMYYDPASGLIHGGAGGGRLRDA